MSLLRALPQADREGGPRESRVPGRLWQEVGFLSGRVQRLVEPRARAFVGPGCSSIVSLMAAEVNTA